MRYEFVIASPTTQTTATLPSTATPLAIAPPPKSVTAGPLPTPLIIPAATLYARLTPTAREMLAMPFPDFLKGSLLVRSDRFNQDMGFLCG